ncbi:MAG TPA: PH domain-containing protein [Pyrinomonadaceae bacterium]|nr:PH domain-containing protein [Pyrinomonadaceae bacterium]
MAAIGAGRSQSGAVLVDRPVTRRAATITLALAAITLTFAALFALCLRQTDPGASSLTWASGIIAGALLVITVGMALDFARLHSERYVVTPDTIEITSGILRRDARKIPFSRVLDVTSNASFDRRLFGLGNITVSIANGDTITIEDITDFQIKAETLWNLVHKT